MKNRIKTAEIYLSRAKDAWHKRFEDDEYIDIACTDLVYSIELCIKHLIEYSGTEVPHTHSVKDLLSALPDEYYSSHWYRILENWKIVTDTWYSDSRYSSSFSAVSAIVQEYMSACDMLLSDASSNVRYDCTRETKVKKVLNKLNSTKTVSEVLKFLPSSELPDDVLYDLVIEILRDKLSNNKPAASSVVDAINKMSGEDS